MAVCLWLLGRKWSGDISSIAGCGGEGGCSEVMGGRWSEWFHLPVTLLAAIVYATVLILTLPPVQRLLGKVGDRWLAAAGVVLGGSAVYFLTLLYGVEHRHCPWCLGLHLTGLLVAALILGDAIRTQGKSGLGVAVLSGFVPLLALGAGQIWGPKPQTYLISGGTSPVSLVPVAAAPSVRGVSFLDGSLKYDANSLPILGSPDAKIVLAEFFDYTCPSCRNLAGDLKELKRKWADTFAVLVLPVPLHRNCNPSLKPEVPDHPGACELARLALAVWKVKPESFPEFHDYLFAVPLPVTIERLSDARNKAISLSSEAAIVNALEDPWVNRQLSENLKAFAQLTKQTLAMPKLLLPPSVVMHGAAPNPGEFLRAIEKQFELTSQGRAADSSPK